MIQVKYIFYLLLNVLSYYFLDVTLALRKARCPYSCNERYRSESKGTRRNGNRVCNGLSIYATAYKSHVSIEYHFFHLFLDY